MKTGYNVILAVFALQAIGCSLWIWTAFHNQPTDHRWYLLCILPEIVLLIVAYKLYKLNK